MTKNKTAWFCNQCGYESAKWLGRCPSCGQWNTFTEEIIRKSGDAGFSDSGRFSDRAARVLRLDEISYEQEPRFSLHNAEIDRILGGGLVEGSVVLIGGEPGIGKSTLSLQIPLQCPHLKTLYVSAEESARQIKMRADRLGGALEKQGPEKQQKENNLLILCEIELETVLEKAMELKPQLLIVDSIQTIYSRALESSAGTVSQVRECAAMLLKFAKQTNTPVILIGHITKDGSLAGPKVLEHIVDVVLQFEGDNRYAYRILRSIKNRFASTAELAIFEMLQSGLREVSNPSEILIPMHDEPLSGTAVAAIIDGTRPFLIETQALVGSPAYGMPQRSATGYDLRRMNMVLAVIEKRAGFKLSAKDVYLNMAGGLRVNDPAVDLAVAVAVLSSTFDIAIDPQWCFSAELGLSGEIRPISHIDRRIDEARRLGFKKIFISGYNARVEPHEGITVVYVNNVGKLLPLLKASPA